jgi:hypothetical protein
MALVVGDDFNTSASLYTAKPVVRELLVVKLEAKHAYPTQE